MNDYPICFEALPNIGTVIPYRKTNLTLVNVGQYEKTDGTTSVILEWMTDEGEICTSGLRGKGVYWRSIEDAQIASAKSKHRRTLA